MRFMTMSAEPAHRPPGPYSEQELKYARPLANAVLDSSDFRRWMFAGTSVADLIEGATPIGDVQAQLRSNRLKNPWWFNYFCPLDKRCECRVGTGIETDILIMFENSLLQRIAAHIEVKRPGDTLGIGQAESYSRRAQCWAHAVHRPRTVPPHEHAITIIACGRDLQQEPRLVFFDKVIFHDELAARLSPYPDT